MRSKNRTETNLCCSINVNGVVYNDDDVAEGFRTHFSNIFSDVHSNEKSFDLVNDDFYKESNPRLVHPFSFEEVSTAIRCLAKRKSPGHDNTLNEHIIHAGPVCASALVTLFNSVLHYEKVPINWQTSILIPLYKGKGKPKDNPSSYRPRFPYTMFR